MRSGGCGIESAQVRGSVVSSYVREGGCFQSAFGNTPSVFSPQEAFQRVQLMIAHSRGANNRE